MKFSSLLLGATLLLSVSAGGSKKEEKQLEKESKFAKLNILSQDVKGDAPIWPKAGGKDFDANKKTLDKYQKYANEASKSIGLKTQNRFSNQGLCVQGFPCETLTNASTAQLDAYDKGKVKVIDQNKISKLLDFLTQKKEVELPKTIHKKVLFGGQAKIEGVIVHFIGQKKKMDSHVLAGHVFNAWKLIALEKNPIAVRGVRAQTDGKPVELMTVCMYSEGSDKHMAKNFCLGRDDKEKMPKSKKELKKEKKEKKKKEEEEKKKEKDKKDKRYEPAIGNMNTQYGAMRAAPRFEKRDASAYADAEPEADPMSPAIQDDDWEKNWERRDVPILSARNIEDLVLRNPAVASFVTRQVSPFIKRDGTEITTRDVQFVLRDPELVESLGAVVMKMLKRQEAAARSLSTRDVHTLTARDPSFLAFQKRLLANFLRRDGYPISAREVVLSARNPELGDFIKTLIVAGKTVKDANARRDLHQQAIMRRELAAREAEAEAEAYAYAYAEPEAEADAYADADADADADAEAEADSEELYVREAEADPEAWADPEPWAASHDDGDVGGDDAGGEEDDDKEKEYKKNKDVCEAAKGLPVFGGVMSGMCKITKRALFALT